MRSDGKPKPHAKPERREKHPQDEALDQELEDSFPASDPPQMTQPDNHPGGPSRPDAAEPVREKDKAKLRHRR